MTKKIVILLMLIMHAVFTPGSAQEPLLNTLKWDQLPALPDQVGFAGPFSGVSNGALLVAGGANFGIGGSPWNKAPKVWYDKIYALESPTGTWKEAGQLPQPLGYGVSLSWRDGMVCIGGSNATAHYADAFIIRYKNGKTETEILPSLPTTNANACGVLIGDIVYIAGGLETPASKATESNFWSLDLSQKDRKWVLLPSWSGPSRMLSVAGTQNGKFYLFSGTELVLNDQGVSDRSFLTDAHVYTPGKGWSQLADLPQPVVAAPSPAFTTDTELMIFGGDSGEYFDQNEVLKEKHPGFSNAILSYRPELNSWSQAGTIQTDIKPNAVEQPNQSIWAPVTTPLVVWNGTVILPSGEVRPGTRTPRVLKASLKTH